MERREEEEEVRVDLVRRFTSDLESDSELAVQTKLYQERVDMDLDQREKKRMDTLYYNPHQVQSPYTEVEIARQSLQDSCQKFFSSLTDKNVAQKDKPTILRPFNRHSAERKLEATFKENGIYNIEDVDNIMKKLEEKWKGSNSKAASNFHKICQKLDAHKDIFKCFPSQTSYTSALCGAVTMIIQTSVNYSTIAEKLSSYVAELSESIAVCREWLNVFDKDNMKARLSEIYKQFFDFFTKVAIWYLKPKTSRFLDSFNSNFSEEHREAKEKIQMSIQLIVEQGHIENAKQVKMIVPDLTQSFASSFAQLSGAVEQNRNENNTAAMEMVALLQESARNWQLARQQIEQLGRYLYDGPGRSQLQHEELGSDERLCTDGSDINDAQSVVKIISREEATSHVRKFQGLIDKMGGSDGLQMTLQAGPLYAEPTTLHRLGEWTQATSGSSQILWIIGPSELGTQTSAILTALGMIRTAVQAKTQFISYVCQRPPYDLNTRCRESKDTTAALAMIYSLILQLLQFRPQDDSVRISQELLDRLDQSTDSWRSALDLLKQLLQHTPVLRYCIIYGLNTIEYEAMDMCREFIETIIDHTKTAHWPIRVLLSTSGQSRVLTSLVPRESILRTTNMFHQMDGRILNRNRTMNG